MKHLLSFLLPLFLLGSIFIGCRDQEAPTSIGDESNTTLNKVTIMEWTDDYNSDLDPPLTDCVTGAPMQYHGVVKLYFKAIITPSGSYIEKGYVDYNAYDGVTLENLSTGEIWTNVSGKNPWTWIEFHNGSLRLHYHWNEVYRLGNQNLNIHVQGVFTIDKDGNITRNLETYGCN